MNTEQGNKLIEDFAKIRISKFNSLRWDIIMPAVHKAIKIIDKKGYPHGIGGGYIPVADLYDLPIHAPVKKVRNKLIDFIVWYNSHTQKQNQ